MQHASKKIIPAALFFFCLFGAKPAHSSHSVGGYMSYRATGTSGTSAIYEVTLTLYVDCLNGDTNAILQDNPAFISVYTNSGTPRFVAGDSAVYYDSSWDIPGSWLNPCVIGGIDYCLNVKKFRTSFTLPASSTGYLVTYQRCCMAGNIVNVTDPGNSGMTICTIIPPDGNNSVVFNRYPQRIACLHSHFTDDLSATDPDGDSLSYEFGRSLAGGGPTNVKPTPLPPPYDSLSYSYPSTTGNPMHIGSGMAIDPVTGVLNCDPDQIGAFYMAVNCIEWRHGAKYNTTTEGFEIIVTNCTGELPISAGNDTAIVAGTSLTFHASGGATYQWLNTTYMSDSTIANPVVSFPAAGVFYYPVDIVTPGGCSGTDTMIVTVIDSSIELMPNAFTPNGDGVNDIFEPKNIGPSTVMFLKVVNIFGTVVYDGTGGWDGTHDGRKMEQGAYAWELKYQNSDGKMMTKRGSVTLLR